MVVRRPSYESVHVRCLPVHFVYFLFVSIVYSIVIDTVRLSPRAHLHVVGMLRFMSDINKPSSPTPFYSVLVPVSVSMALSTVIHSINSSDNSPFSDLFFQPYLFIGLMSLYIALRKSPSALI